MAKFKNIICLLILSMILSCTSSSGIRHGEKLPTEGTTEQAQEIIQRIMSNGFADTFLKKFPQFNPKEHNLRFNTQNIDRKSVV